MIRRWFARVGAGAAFLISVGAWAAPRTGTDAPPLVGPDARLPADDEPKAVYGPPPAPPKDEPCEPVAIYGPPMCDSDEQCVKQNGPGWYCDQEHAYDTGCGGKAVWPLCAPPKTPPAPEN